MSFARRGFTMAKSRRGTILHVAFVCLVASLAACTLKLEDKSAPSFEFSLEADYDVARWGGDEKSGWAATPPSRKQGRAKFSGTAFRIRGQFTNTLTWYDADGTLTRGAFQLGDEEFPERAIPVKADGWRYRGRLAILPGFSFGGDKFFIAGLFGLEGDYLGMDLMSAEDPSLSVWTEFGRFGVPVGCHLEGTLWHVATPYVTYAYVPTISSWGIASGEYTSATKLAVRLWPGSLLPAFGSLLWLEGGWQWTSSKGASLPFFEYEINLSGPYGGIGLRF